MKKQEFNYEVNRDGELRVTTREEGWGEGGWGKGRLVAEGFVKGIHNGASAVRSASHEMALMLVIQQAVHSAVHADWFVALPWYRRWWVMVRGK